MNGQDPPSWKQGPTSSQSRERERRERGSVPAAHRRTNGSCECMLCSVDRVMSCLCCRMRMLRRAGSAKRRARRSANASFPAFLARRPPCARSLRVARQRHRSRQRSGGPSGGRDRACRPPLVEERGEASAEIVARLLRLQTGVVRSQQQQQQHQSRSSCRGPFVRRSGSGEKGQRTQQQRQGRAAFHDQRKRSN